MDASSPPDARYDPNVEKRSVSTEPVGDERVQMRRGSQSLGTSKDPGAVAVFMGILEEDDAVEEEEVVKLSSELMYPMTLSKVAIRGGGLSFLSSSLDE
jgi:hypothetical protein